MPYVLIDKVTYHDSAFWPAGADGYGLSLQRRVPAQYGNDPANWMAAPPNAGGASPPPGGGPQISQQPTNQQIIVYHDGGVGVIANGPNLHYQWRFNGALIADGTNATLLLPNFQLDESGDYQVVVFNSTGSQVSSVAHLEAFFPVAILAEPQTQTVRLPTVTSVVGTNIVFAVSALSSGLISYQWMLNDFDIPKATNSTYKVTSVSTNSGGTYKARVSDMAVTLVSDPADLVVQVTPVLTRGIPAQTQAFQGDDVTFSVSISGFPPPFTYQWRKGASTALTNIVSYATNSSFTLFNVQPTDTSLYRVSITNSVPNITIISTTSLTVLPDADHDHLPDSWETQFGFNPNDPSDGNADPDHDGLLNWQEFLAGTNPTNALSVLKVDSLTVSNQSVLKFQALSNHTYAVQYTPSLTNANWLSLSNLVSRTTNRTVTISEPKQSSGRFYRLVTPQQP